uniref:Calpain catalytic domain-containing protein n=1 Tax=Rhabditophanes sp. KR3021 TaxID=114890 RepID=A0AC35TRK0_9BILA
MDTVKKLAAVAIGYDEKGMYDAAIVGYIKCIEEAMERIKIDTNQTDKAQLGSLIAKFIERAELLKGMNRVTVTHEMFPQVPNSILDVSDSPTIVSRPTSSNEGLSIEEIKVLMKTSCINNIKYMPFLDVDLAEKFTGQGHFKDIDGPLKLAQKQKERLVKWESIKKLTADNATPVMIHSLDCRAVKQTVVSDCSLVASLCITADYERKFKKQLISKIIFPQRNGIPIYNPYGKYMVLLYVNGVKRKVIIDDYLPVGDNNRLLCSLSKNKDFWVSLIEKAYLKMMGGYDFCGSSSNIDLYCLTGFIPERISLKSTPDKPVDHESIFAKLCSRFVKGHCLITLATGPLSKEEQERTGLVELHAYGLLDLRDVHGLKLIKLKNPWTHEKWKGKFCEKDLTSWTAELQKTLDYSPLKAQQEEDDGIFWIDYKSLINFFDVFYVNWDPSIFPHFSVVHDEWNSCAGPVKDLYSVSSNPQYTLDVYSEHDACSVWILLTRHITEITDFADNKEYITVMVYEDGKKIYLPFDKKPISNSARINSPHSLSQIMLKGKGKKSLTLVVAQYEKSKTIDYSLRVYATEKVLLKKIVPPYKFSEKTNGKITVDSSTDKSKFLMVLDEGSDRNDLLFELKAPKEYYVSVQLTPVSLKRPNTNKYEIQRSDKYRSGYNILELESVPAGTYRIEVKTYVENQEGAFFLFIHSTCRFKTKPA